MNKTSIPGKAIISSTPSAFPNVRMRRLRENAKLRTLIRETTLSVHDFIFPLFIHHGTGVKKPISSMPGLFQISIDYLAEEINEIVQLGIPGIILFGIPAHKDALGSDSYHEHGIVQTAIREIKKIAPELLVISDICFCEYTDHGHCGYINDQQQLDNDRSLNLLMQQAVSHAQAGCDVIAPSGMLDGMVAALRQALDNAGFCHIPILSYSAKYCSAFYGPFREAAQGTPQFGNRATYQMDPANASQALREVALDIAEGTDMIMVKPALIYLDIIYQVKQNFPGLPLCAYQVSGEYAMLKAASQNGWLDEKKTIFESLISIKRAGADFIISYFAKDVAKWLAS